MIYIIKYELRILSGQKPCYKELKIIYPDMPAICCEKHYLKQESRK